MKQSRIAVVAVGLSALCAGLAEAQPFINDNFVSNIAVSANRETVLQLFDQSPVVLPRNGTENARVYEWYSGQMMRVDFQNPDMSTEQVFQFWPGAQLPSCPNVPASFTTGIQYNYFSATDTCTQAALPAPPPAAGFFDFLQQANQNGTCSANGRSGTMWVVPDPLNNAPCRDGSTCACANGNTPIQLQWPALGAAVMFNTFTPGVPAPSNFCPPAACAAAAETHDSVVLPRAPLNISIPAGASTVSKIVHVTVANADILPAPESPGHTIQLVAGGNCPADMVVGIPDFGKAAVGPADTVVVPGGTTKTAKVTLSIDSAAWTTFNADAPRRCTLILTARTVAPSNWFEPTPANNSVSIEINVTDNNDPGQSTPHESLVRSIAPVTVTLKAGTTSQIRSTRAMVVDADILPVAETSGDLITITTSDGDCPAGTVGVADYDRGTAGAQNTVTLTGGKSRPGSLPLTIHASAFATTSGISPSRCTALVTAKGPLSPAPDPDPSNNVTRLVIDVVDGNDF